MENVPEVKETTPQIPPEKVQRLEKPRVPFAAKFAFLTTMPAVMASLVNMACDEEAERITPPPTPRPAITQIFPKVPPPPDSQTIEVNPTTPPISHTETTTPPSTTPSESPTPAETPQELWVIDSSQVSGESSVHRTPEQDAAIIKEIAQKFPHPFEVKIVLTDQLYSRTVFNTPPTAIQIEIGRNAYLLERKAAAEFANLFNPDLNRQRLTAVYPASTFEQMQSLYEQIIANYQNLSIDYIFSKDKNHLTDYADALFIGQNTLPGYGEGSGYPLDNLLFANQLKSEILDGYVAQTQGQTNPYLGFSEFLAGEKEKIAALKNANPFYKAAFDYLEQRSQTLNDNSWAVGMPVKLTSLELGQYWQMVVPTFVNMALTELFRNNNPEVLSMLDQTTYQQIETNFQKLLKIYQNELFQTIYWHALLEPAGDELMLAYHGLVTSIQNS